MTNGKIIVVNNRTAEKAKRAIDMHAAKRRGAVGSGHLDCSAGRPGQGHLLGANCAAVISALRGDIYYAQSVQTMPCWRACVCGVWRHD